VVSNGHARFLQPCVVVVVIDRDVLRGDYVDECPDENYPIHKGFDRVKPPIIKSVAEVRDSNLISTSSFVNIPYRPLFSHLASKYSHNRGSTKPNLLLSK